ncbi:MAG: hypothetical protein JWP02_3550, partial [Acidimicrobiales bacterium]|nr:hypothetical protein [Acidimicrobiales bacterium]
MPVPTRRLAAVAALAAVVVLFAPVDAGATLLVVEAALLLTAVVDWALAPAPATVAVERELPGVLALDGEGEVVWHVRNPTHRRLRVGLADELA